MTDGPNAVDVNPAGIGFQRGLSLRYLHETAPGAEGDLATADGDGLYLGTRFLDAIGFGVAMEWVRPEGAPSLSLLDYRRTSWALALGDEALAIGGAAHVFTRGFLDDHTTWDVGLMARPLRFLSVGFTVRDVDGPSAHGVPLPRKYIGAVGLRPLGDWLTLAADFEVLGAENESIDHGFDAAALAYTGRARIFDGLTILASATHRVDGEGPVVIQAGLAIDTAHLGLEGTPLIRSHGSTGFLIGAELRARPRPGLERPARKVAVVDLSEALSPPPSFQVLPSEPRDPMVDLVAGLDRLAADGGVGAVVLKIRSLPDVGMGQAYEIRQAIRAFRASGKPIVALLYGADDAAYYLASTASRIYATPDAALFINGFASEAAFFGGTLEKIGVSVDVAKVGAYKNAPDALVRDRISDEQKEVMRAILDDLFPRYVADVAEARGLDPAAFRGALDQGVLTARQARDAGLIDGVLYPDQLTDETADLIGHSATLEATTLQPAPWTSWGPAREIAVIPIVGTITSGRTEGGLGFVTTTGARSVVQAIDAAADDPCVRAIVLRIDSPGGDAGGSQLIWRAVVQAREKKPVIASMGDTAASGGYFAAVGANRIFAAPGTITGSIGIFWIKPSLAGLLDELDVGTYAEKRGAQADIGSFRKSWSPAERASVQRYVDAFYQQFIEATAAGRSLPVDEVDAVARGRVWTGAQARERHLVDELGGLASALRAAKAAAGLAPDAKVRYRVYRPTASLFGLEDGASLELPGAAASIPEPIRRVVAAKIPLPLLVPNPSGLWAVAPFTWRLH